MLLHNCLKLFTTIGVSFKHLNLILVTRSSWLLKRYLARSHLLYSFLLLFFRCNTLFWDIQISVENPVWVKNGRLLVLNGLKFQIHDGMVTAWKKLFTLGLVRENQFVWNTGSKAVAWVVSRKSVLTAREPTVLSVMESEVDFLFSRKH